MAVVTKEGKPRFATVNEEEFLDILKNKDSANTQRATEKCVKAFKAYLTSKELPTDFEEWDKSRLSAVLSKYYVEVRREDGELYKTGSMINIRAGLNRYLKGKGKAIDLIKEPVFSEANLAFTAQQVKLKQQGRGDTEHYNQIDENDMTKLYNSGVLDESNPRGLQYKVWFSIMLYICRRGRENLRKLTKEHFKIGTDSNGRRFVCQARDEMTKKVRENNGTSRVDTGRMYETNSKGCPVAAFEKYIEKLNPKCDALFQTPMTNKDDTFDWESTTYWYKNCPVGERSIGEMMAKISKAANLSKRYTNHSLRTTCIQILDEGGFASRDICNVSGHANERSLRTYVRQPCDAKKQRMSDAISSSTGNIPVSSPAPSAKSKHATTGHPSTSTVTNVDLPSCSDPVMPVATSSLPTSPILTNSQIELLTAENDFGDILSMEDWDLDDLNVESQIIQSQSQTQTAAPAPNTTVTSQSQVTRNVRVRQVQRHLQQQPLTFHGCTVNINYNFHQ